MGWDTGVCCGNSSSPSWPSDRGFAKDGAVVSGDGGFGLGTGGRGTTGAGQWIDFAGSGNVAWVVEDARSGRGTGMAV